MRALNLLKYGMIRNSLAIKDLVAYCCSGKGILRWSQSFTMLITTVSLCDSRKWWCIIGWLEDLRGLSPLVRIRSNLVKSEDIGVNGEARGETRVYTSALVGTLGSCKVLLGFRLGRLCDLLSSLWRTERCLLLYLARGAGIWGGSGSRGDLWRGDVDIDGRILPIFTSRSKCE